jgi:hypothetical protein
VTRYQLRGPGRNIPAAGRDKRGPLAGNAGKAAGAAAKPRLAAKPQVVARPPIPPPSLNNKALKNVGCIWYTLFVIKNKLLYQKRILPRFAKAPQPFRRGGSSKFQYYPHLLALSNPKKSLGSVRNQKPIRGLCAHRGGSERNRSQKLTGIIAEEPGSTSAEVTIRAVWIYRHEAQARCTQVSNTAVICAVDVCASFASSFAQSRAT